MVGHSLVFQILLPAWTNSAGMLSTPADFFPIFGALTTTSTSSRRIG